MKAEQYSPAGVIAVCTLSNGVDDVASSPPLNHMGFPVAIGTKSVASRHVKIAAQPSEEVAADGCVLHPSIPSPPTVVWTNSADHELLAIVTFSYYDMLREDSSEIEYCNVEIRVQISPTGAHATSLDDRDSLYRLELPSTKYPRRDAAIHERSVKQMAMFSADRRFLACLIPHPFSERCVNQDTSVVVFQLRKPKKMKRPRPPLPSYIPATVIADPCVVVATNPRILVKKVDANGSSEPLLNVTALCDVTTSVPSAEPSILFLGSQDGSISVASYRPLILAGLLYQHPNSGGDDSVAIAALDHYTEWCDADDGTVVGRLAVVLKNGSVAVFRSHLADSMEDASDIALPECSVSIRSNVSAASPFATKHSAFAIGLTATHDQFGGCNETSDSPVFVCAKWIHGSSLALLQQPDAECAIHVFGLYDEGRCAPVSTMIITMDRLEESAGVAFRADAVQSFTGSIRPVLCPGTIREARVFVDYDPYSDCVSVSSFLSNGASINSRRGLPFVCLWHWRTNAQGLLVVPNVPDKSESICISSLHFAVDHLKGRKLVHMLSFFCGSKGLRLRKETYDTSILSPPHEATCRLAIIGEASSLLLSSTSVSFPTASKPSTRENFEMRWSESILPQTYLSAFGSPVVAAVGKNLGRSVAVACTRGLCILDLHGTDRTNVGPKYRNKGCHEKLDVSLSKILRLGHAHPRWRMFGNEADEKAFRVVAMSWWEGAAINSEDFLDNGIANDLLIAVIEVVEGQEDCGFYISCWSSKNVDLFSQLICPGSEKAARTKGTKWGGRLPIGFIPEFLDLLACPLSVDDFAAPAFLGRKACVLLTDTNHCTNYRIYQLQVVTSRSESVQKHTVLTRCCAVGKIGSPAALFLASASFAFSLRETIDDAEGSEVSEESVAVIGVLRILGGGMDAFSVRSSSVMAVGQIIESVDREVEHPRESEVSRLWLSDVVLDRNFSDDDSRADFFVWVVQLASGRLVSWSVPFVRSIDDLHYLTQTTRIFSDSDRNAGATTVHPGGMSLGIVRPAGAASHWMQQSSNGARVDFLVGHVPRSYFGCIIGVAQSGKKLHSVFGEDFEKDLFRSDFFYHEVLCPSDFILYPPGSLPSWYSLAMDAVSSRPVPKQVLYHFDRHIKCRTTGTALKHMPAMSIQLMVLRSVEKLATIGIRRGLEKSLKRDLVRGLLIALVDNVRCHATPLQFVIFFLTMGRQVEPSSYPHLFPLPASLSDTAGGISMDDLFDDSLAFGSIGMSVAAMPLLVDSETTMSMCVAAFHYCLNHLDSSLERVESYELVIAQEERTAIGDVFRYALKLHDRGPGADQSDDSDEEGRTPARGYSIMCGLGNILSRRRDAEQYIGTRITTDASPLLVHRLAESKTVTMRAHNVQKLLPWRNSGEGQFASVAAVAARYILSSIFDSDGVVAGWTRVGALAALLLGDSRTDFSYCTASEFADLVHATRPNRYGSMFPFDERRNGSLPKFLECSISRCEQVTDAEVASRVLDLVLILLGFETSAFAADIPGLLLVSIVSAHVSGRLLEIMSPFDDSLLWTSYLEVQFNPMSHVQRNGIEVHALDHPPSEELL